MLDAEKQKRFTDSMTESTTEKVGRADAVRRLSRAAIFAAAVSVLLRAVPGMKFSALLFFLASLVLLVFAILEHAARQGNRTAARCRIALLALLAVGLALFAAMETMVIRGAAVEDTDAPVCAVIVLGAGVNGETPSLTLKTRIDAAEAYLREHPDLPVILSGGQGEGEDITEAECMRCALVSRGIDAGRLYLEEHSTSTAENMEFSRAILESLGLDDTQRVAIITSDFHLCRARLLWGGAATAVPAHFPEGLHYAALTVNYYVREAFALAAFYVFGG